MSHYTTNAISLINLKESALYFDHVIPANLGIALLLSTGPRIVRDTDAVLRDVEKYLPRGLTSELLPAHLRNHSGFQDRLQALQDPMFYLSLKAALAGYGLPPHIAGVTPEQLAALDVQVPQLMNALVDDFDLSSYQFDVSPPTLDEDTSDCPMLTIASLKLIDSSKAAWSHILEFRKSSESRSALQRLRLFAFDTYQGKSRDYIEDDLGQRLATYHATIDEWGFNTRTGAMTSVLKSKTMAGALAGTLVSTLFGEPMAALVSLAGGALLECGGVALEIRSRQFLLAKLTRENPVTFIDLAQKSLGEL
jgi:hypothetical protein